MSKEKEMSKENYFTAWSVYDSMIQSYRSSMIASQSLLLAVEAVTLEKSSLIGFIVCIIGLIQLWYIWFFVVKNRAIISDFYKYNAFYDFVQRIDINGNEIPEDKKVSKEYKLNEDVYVESKSIRDRANSKLAEIEKNSKLKSNCRPTRCKLDIIMPISFTVIWMSFIALHICRILNFKIYVIIVNIVS